MEKLILALDLGLTSCGYSVLKEKNRAYELVDYGVVMRDNPYDGNTQKERSLHLQQRKLIKKKRARVKKLKKLFKAYGIHYQERNYSNLWELRVKDVFERELDGSEFFALLRYLAKHRGYKSLKIEDLIAEIEAREKIGDCESDHIEIPDAENFTETLAYLDALKCKYKEKTAAQIIYEIESDKENPCFRNHDNYRYMIRREDVAQEIQKIVQAQEKFNFFHDAQDAENFLKELYKIIIEQDPVTLNEALINNCQLYQDEKCAPIYSYKFDLFNFYKVINDLTVDGVKISQEQKELLIDDFFQKLKTKKSIPSYKVSDVLKLLELEDDCKINKMRAYKLVKGTRTPNLLVRFNFIAKWGKFDQDILGKLFTIEDILDELATILHRNVDPRALIEDAVELFKKYDICMDTDKIQSFVLMLYKQKTSGVCAYSFKALTQLLNYMKEGRSESDAKEILGVKKAEDYTKFNKGIKYLKPVDKQGTLQYELDENRISNHVVKSLVAWANRVIVSLHDKHGTFDLIKLESTRELSTPDDVKNKIKSANDKNQKYWNDLKSRYKEQAKAKGIDLDKSNSYVLKLKLYEQQKTLGIYSLKQMGIDDILSDKTEIEHIIPRACGGSNAEYNKAVDFKNENAQKGNRLPLDYLNGDASESYRAFVQELKDEHRINFKKMKNLLAESLDEAFIEASDTVSLHATSYTEKLLGEILKRYYPFDEKIKQNQRVMHISGRATSYLRRILSIDNKSRETNFHHAEDAILIAIMSRTYLQKISTTFRENYNRTKEEAQEHFKTIAPLIDGALPNEIFAHLRKSYLKDIDTNPFYIGIDGSLKTPAFWVNKKPIGTKAHNETIQSQKNFSYRVTVSSLLDKVKVNYKTSIEKFIGDYNKEIYNKLQVVRDNPKDFTALSFAKKRDEVVQALQKGLFITTKEEEQALNRELLLIMRAPVLDVNGNEIHRVKRIGEVVSIPIRKGLAATAPSLVCLRCAYDGTKKLQLRRIDVRAYSTNRDSMAKEIDIFNNDLAEIYIWKSKKVEHKVIGVVKGFTESKGGRINIRNPKYPLLKEKQPKIYKSEFSIGSICGIKKYKTDALGNILGFYYLGHVLHNDEEFFAKVVTHRRI